MKEVHRLPPLGVDEVILTFNCENCGLRSETEPLQVPEASYITDAIHNSRRSTSDTLICARCNREYVLHVDMSRAGGEVSIEGLSDHTEVEVEEITKPDPYEMHIAAELDAALSNPDYYRSFQKSIADLRRLNEMELPYDSLRETLSQQLFVGVISTMEAYLMEAFLQTVFSEEDHFRSFVQTFGDYSEKKITLDEIYEWVDKIEADAKERIGKLSLHNVVVAKRLFENTFGLSFPDLGKMVKRVEVRHHLVHRNGKDEDGEDVQIGQSDVEDLLDEVDSFVNKVDGQLDVLR